MASEIRFSVEALKGRGSASHTPHRFQTEHRCTEDDGWGTMAEELADRRGPRTQVIFEDARIPALSG